MKTTSKNHNNLVGKRVVYNGLYYYINDSIEAGNQIYVGLQAATAGSQIKDWIKIEEVEFCN